MLRFKARLGEALATKATPEGLAKLAPYGKLAPSKLERLCDHARFYAVKAGKLPDLGRADEAIFLNSGQIEISGLDGNKSSLSSVSPPARFPLPTEGGFQFRIIQPATFLVAPAPPKRKNGRTEFERELVGLANLGEPIRDELRQLQARLRERRYSLPSMPDLAMRLNAVLRNPNSYSRDISKLIQIDPALATKIMHVVNSAAFRFRHEARNIQQAVTRLGRDRVHNLAIGFLLRSAFRTQSAKLKRKTHGLWLEGCHVAAVSFALAKLLPSVDPERAMLAGLIHKIGALPIYALANDFPALLQDMHAIEFAVRHFQRPLAIDILEQWDLGEDLTEVVRCTGRWQRTGYAVPDYADVVLLAQLHALVGKREHEHLPRIDELPAFQKLEWGKLTPKRSIAALEDAEQDIRELRQILMSGS